MSESAAEPQAEDVKPEGLAEAASDAPAEGEEVKQEEVKPAVPDPRTRQFAALSRKEREVKSLMAQQRQQAAQVEEFQRAISNARQDPASYLKMAGLTYEEVAKHFAATGELPGEGDAKPPTTDPRMEERLQRTEQQLQEAMQRLEQEKEDRAVKGYLAEISSYVQDKDEFELIRHYDAVKDVYELIDLHYRRTQEVMGLQEASERIEQAILDHKSEEAQRAIGAKKIKLKLGLYKEEPETASDKTSKSPSATGKQSKPTETYATHDEKWEALVARARAAGAKSK